MRESAVERTVAALVNVMIDNEDELAGRVSCLLNTTKDAERQCRIPGYILDSACGFRTETATLAEWRDRESRTKRPKLGYLQEQRQAMKGIPVYCAVMTISVCQINCGLSRTI